jgi:4-hydroxy-2-oxoheptanedioate aldolase
MGMPFRQAWNAGEPTYGGWCSIPSPFSVELLGGVGFDWLCLDLEHGGADAADLVPLLQAAAISRTPTFVRVPWNEPGVIMKSLDAGAVGVIIPMVSSAEAAVSGAGACRYPPEGYRSWGPMLTGQRTPGFTPEMGNRSVICAAMIETVEAVEQIDAILEVAGVDAVFVGPADLALSAGLPATAAATEPGQRERLRRVVEACRAHGKVAGIFAGAEAAALRETGFRMLAVTTDARELTAGARSALAAAKVSR